MTPLCRKWAQHRPKHEKPGTDLPQRGPNWQPPSFNKAVIKLTHLFWPVAARRKPLNMILLHIYIYYVYKKYQKYTVQYILLVAFSARQRSVGWLLWCPANLHCVLMSFWDPHHHVPRENGCKWPQLGCKSPGFRHTHLFNYSEMGMCIQCVAFSIQFLGNMMLTKGNWGGSSVWIDLLENPDLLVMILWWILSFLGNFEATSHPVMKTC